MDRRRGDITLLERPHESPSSADWITQSYSLSLDWLWSASRAGRQMDMVVNTRRPRASTGRCSGRPTRRQLQECSLSVTAEDEAPAPDPALVELRASIASLVRGDATKFDSVLVAHGDPHSVPDTGCSIRAHYVRADANGRPRLQALSRQLAKQIVKFCIPRTDVAKARLMSDDDREEELSRLTLDAQRLFTTSQPKTGEGGELLLYTLLEFYLGIPQILSKMSLKTNTELQVNGSDGLHAQITASGALALYWGESKIYDDFGAALTSCFDSVAPFLRQEGAERQDVYLMQHFADTGDLQLTRALIDYFDDDLPQSASVELRAGCLIGFPLDDYPHMPDVNNTHQDTLDRYVREWETKVNRRLTQHGLTGFQIELFIVPLPSAADFRTEMKKALNLSA